jgi:phage-related protein (TIGR01555 family)
MGFFGRFADGLANIVTGMGTTNDRRSYARYLFRQLDHVEISAAYRSSWMVRKGINLPPYDMTHAGRDWQADKAAIEALEAEEERLQLWAKLRLGLVFGRLGGGAMIIGVGNENAALPINPRSLGLKSINHLTLWTRWQLTLGPKVTDPASEYFGGPEYYTFATGGDQVRIHPSRVIPFRGAQIVPGTGTSWLDEFWGDSTLQAVEDAIKNAESAQNGFASLINEAKIDVYKIPGLTALAATAEFESALTKRMQTSNLFKSQYNALLLDAGDGMEGSGEDWETRQVTWTGIPQIVMMYVSLVAGAFDIPATRFIGKSPDGMNATGQGDENAYWAMIKALQTSDVKPLLNIIDPLLIPSALGKTDDSVWWEFAPLRETTETEEAANFDKTMDAVTKLQATGTIPSEALEKATQNLMEERGWMPGLADALADMPPDERFPSLSEPDPNEVDPALVDPGLDPATPPPPQQTRKTPQRKP